ncbi:MAG TPA: carboxypeptidase-like regulatory domain-containing protein [Gemmatimonadaceae bacterium]|nr:carboxypeptidase-like regulatory domain-containing protein [Gemmatimonadaceae bacterium]
MWTAVVAPAALTANRAGAQQRDSMTAVLRGRVVRQSDGAPIAGADVWSATADRHATTDSTGAFTIDHLASGVHLVQVRRLGFDVSRDTVRISAEHENVRTYALAVQAARLDTVRTRAANRSYISPQLQAFEERRLSGQGGHFISDSVFRRNENTTLANLIASRVPGVMLQPLGIGQVLASTRKQCQGLAFQHSGKCKEGIPDCYVTIYVDGALYYTPPPPMSNSGGPPPPDLSRSLDPTQFAGAEFYAGGASAPAGMHSNDQGCGTLWLWTRER